MFAQAQLRDFLLATAEIRQLPRRRAAVWPAQREAAQAALRREARAIVQATPNIDYRTYIRIARAVQHNYGLRLRLQSLVQDLRRAGRIDDATGIRAAP